MVCKHTHISMGLCQLHIFIIFPQLGIVSSSGSSLTPGAPHLPKDTSIICGIYILSILTLCLCTVTDGVKKLRKPVHQQNLKFFFFPNAFLVLWEQVSLSCRNSQSAATNVITSHKHVNIKMSRLRLFTAEPKIVNICTKFGRCWPVNVGMRTYLRASV